MKRVLVAIGAVTALFVSAALPASAQFDIAELPELGFEIDPNEGFPGDTIDAQVDVDDIAEHCETDAATFADDFVSTLGPLVEQYVDERETEGVDDEEELWEDGSTEADVLHLFDEAMGALFFGLGTPDTQEQLHSEMFVLTFADIATQDLVGPTGNYDWETGVGSMEVPDLDPQLYAFVATCIALAEGLDTDDIDAAYQQFRAYVIENELTLEIVTADGMESVQEFLQAVLPLMLPELIEPQALGIELYCVLNPDGTCGEPPPEEEPTEEPEPEPAPEPEPTPAEPVTAEPTFTG